MQEIVNYVEIDSCNTVLILLVESFRLFRVLVGKVSSIIDDSVIVVKIKVLLDHYEEVNTFIHKLMKEKDLLNFV